MHTSSLLVFNLEALLSDGDRAVLRLHVCDAEFDFSEATVDTDLDSYAWSASLDWTSASSVRLYLSQQGDETPPRVERAAVAGSVLTLTYDELLDGTSVPDAADFSVSVNGAPARPTAVSVSAATVTLTLAAPVPPHSAVTVDYEPMSSPLRDHAGNEAAALDGHAVANLTVGLSLKVTRTLLREGDSDAGETRTTVTASVRPTRTAAFAVEVSATPASSRYEFEDGGTTLGFAANAGSSTGTVTLRTVHNDAADGDLEVVLAGTPSDAAVAGPAPVAVTIRDDDRASVDHLTGTMTVAADGDSLGFFHGSSVRHGTLDARTFACCPGGAGELEYTVKVLALTGTPALLAFGTEEEDPAPDGRLDALALRLGGEHTYLFSDAAEALVLGVRRRVWFDHGETWSAADSVAVQVAGPAHPRIADVAFVSTPTAMSGSDTVYGVGQRIRVRVTYTEPVAVTGAPHFVLQVGSNDRNATYLSGSGTDTLEFAYTVAPADMDTDGVGFERDADDGTDVFESPIVLEAGDKIESVAVRAMRTASRHIPSSEAAERTGGVDGSQTPPKPALTVADVAVDENAGAAILTVTLGYPAAADVTFEYATANGTATAGSDYEAISGRKTIAAGDTTTTLEIAILDDTEDEAPGETFTVTLSDPSGNAQLGAAKTATVTIRDDDLPTVSILKPAAADATGYLFENEASETGDGAWALTREGYLGEALEVSVDVWETGIGSSTLLKTAPGTDTVTFQASSATASFNPIEDDTDDDSHGRVTVELQAGAAYAMVSSLGNAQTAVVRDDDGDLIQASLDPDRLSVAEGRKARVEAVFTTVPTGTFTAQGDFERVFGRQTFNYGVTTNGIDATGTADYAPISVIGTVDFGDFARAGGTGPWVARYPHATDVKEDDVVDADERFVIAIEGTGGLPAQVFATEHMISGYSESPLAAAEVTITEGVLLTLVLSDATLAEGDDAAGAERTTVTATLAEAVDTAFAVAVSTAPAPAGFRPVRVRGREPDAVVRGERDAEHRHGDAARGGERRRRRRPGGDGDGHAGHGRDGQGTCWRARRR